MALQFQPPPFQQRPDYERQGFYGMVKGVGDLGELALQLSKMKRQREQQAIENARKSRLEQQVAYEAKRTWGEDVPYWQQDQVSPPSPVYTQDRLSMLNDIGNTNPRPYLVDMSTGKQAMTPMENSAQRFNEAPMGMFHKPGFKDMEFAQKERELLLKRQENQANQAWTRQMQTDKFGLQQDVFGLKKSAEEAKAEAARVAAENLKASRISDATDVIDSVDRAMGKVSWKSTGAVGDLVTSHISGSQRRNLEADITHIQSLLGLGKLAEMKAQSKQGASGFGQLSDKEMKLLTAAVQTLDPDMSTKQVEENLKRVKKHYQNFLLMLDGVNPYDYPETQPGNTVSMNDIPSGGRGGRLSVTGFTVSQ